MPPYGIKYQRKPNSISSISGGEILDLWINLGSLEKVSNHLFDKGIKSRANKPVNSGILSNAVYKWACDNVELAWEKYSAAGTPFTRIQWERWLIRKAVRFIGYSRDAFLDWIKAHNFEDHKDIYERRFPDIADDRLG